MKPCRHLLLNTIFLGITALSAQVHAQGLRLSSNAAFVQDATTSAPLFSKNADLPLPIASMTKLMTAMVILDANLPMDQSIEVTDDDVDTMKHSRSRLSVGSILTRAELLHLALMSSENRATHALARTYPGGVAAAVSRMNQKAHELNLHVTHFTDPTGLYSTNVASPVDMATLAGAAYNYDKIREYTTDTDDEFSVRGRTETFRNTNSLVRGKHWPIELSKTGFIEEAGRCMVIRTAVNDKHVFMVLMNSTSSAAREQDARKIKSWLGGENTSAPVAARRVHHHISKHGHTQHTVKIAVNTKKGHIKKGHIKKKVRHASQA